MSYRYLSTQDAEVIGYFLGILVKLNIASNFNNADLDLLSEMYCFWEGKKNV